MININLIPIALRKKSGHKGIEAMGINLPHEIIIGVGAGFALLLILLHVALGIVMANQMARHTTAQWEWERLLPDKNNLDAIANEVKDLKKKMNTIRDITAKQSIGWSRNLNVISDSMPKGLWLRRIALDAHSFVIEGSAVSKMQNEISTVGDFVSNLKKDEVFMKAFVGLEVNSIQRTKKNTTDLAEFSITVKQR